jgi:septal ring factor EnvC (AmiA/AmiB activator)
LQATELSTWQRRVSELTGRISELEETLAKTQKELLKAQEANAKLQRDLRENVAQKEDQVDYLTCCFYVTFPLSVFIKYVCIIKFIITGIPQ